MNISDAQDHPVGVPDHPADAQDHSAVVEPETRYFIEHETCFDYSSSVMANENVVRLTPRAYSSDWRITTDPLSQTEFSACIDPFGNRVTQLHHAGPHTRYTISASGLVAYRAPYGAGAQDHSVAGVSYLEETGLADFCDISKECSRGGSVASIIDAVRARMEYRTGATNVSTRASEALALGCGVCQDFVHAALAALRQAGHRARYVSGYCFGEGSMHAWVEVMDPDDPVHPGPNGAWRAIDPTNVITDSHRLISVAVGRDYKDACPIRGSYLGAASSTMKVSVRMVEKVENNSADNPSNPANLDYPGRFLSGGGE